MIEFEKEDGDDIGHMFYGLQNSDIPESMNLLWLEQKKILNSKKQGYRWHPK